MSALRVKTTECKIGLLGLYNAGKTAFLTSLLDHLEHHESDRFRLGDGQVTLRKFQRLPPDPGWVEFNASGYRDALVHQGRWPEKTRDCSMFTCSLERSDWKFSDALLKFYDLPGERLADAPMLSRSYAEWSEYTLNLIENDTAYRQHCAEFLQQLQQPKPEWAELLKSYKHGLARLILAYQPRITPSTFLIDTQGGKARPDTAEKLAESRYSGLDATAEFVPLPSAVLKANPELLAKCRTAYDQYKREVVTPYLEALRSCTSLIILIDVTMILSAGTGMYNDNRQIIQDLFDVLNPGESTLGTINRHLAKVFLPHQIRPHWITRVAFVAPKLDQIHPLDRSRMTSLTRQLVGKMAANIDGLKHEFFNCSAVKSTRMLSEQDPERWMVGIPFRNPEGVKIAPGVEQRFQVSELPAEWPRNWQPGQYHFPEVYPAVPTRRDCPPEQINLDRILNFVMD